MIGFAAGAYSVWFCTLTAQNQLDISAGQCNTSPIYGKVGIAIGLKSLSVVTPCSSRAWCGCPIGSIKAICFRFAIAVEPKHIRLSSFVCRETLQLLYRNGRLGPVAKKTLLSQNGSCTNNSLIAIWRQGQGVRAWDVMVVARNKEGKTARWQRT